MEPEGSFLQVPAICPYPEPARASLWPHTPIPEDPSYYYPPIYAWVFQVALSLRFPHQTLYYLFSPPICATCSANRICLYLITRTMLGEEYRSLRSSPLPCHLVLLRPQYSPQHSILKHPQPTFLPQYERPRITFTQNNGKDYWHPTYTHYSHGQFVAFPLAINQLRYTACQKSKFTKSVEIFK